MADQVVDYSWSYPGADTIAGAGYLGAMRYLGWDGRCLTAWERDELLAADLGIGLIWELAADRVLDGWGAGVEDAVSANRCADELGAPGDRPIYYATDFGASDAEIAGPILDYYLGAHSVGGREVRCYGGAPVIEAVLRALNTGPGWQAAAASWSDYRLSPDASLLQEVEQIWGNSADVNTCLCDTDDIDWFWGFDMALSDDDLNKIGALIDERIAKLYTGQRALKTPGEPQTYELMLLPVGDGEAMLVRRYIDSQTPEMRLRRYADHLAEVDWTGDPARVINDPELADYFRSIPVVGLD